MKVDGGVGLQVTEGHAAHLDDAGPAARRLEAAGFDAAWTAEVNHDPFLPLTLAAEHTERIQLGTSIAVAFARNPMTLAQIGWDLQEYSRGRLLLGLGSQIEAHITKRFSMPWSRPAARMKEMVLAIHAIWDAWQDGSRLDFRGDFYQHTLMTPTFSPGPNPYGSARVFISAVGPQMLRTCGEVCDGWLVHGFTTPAYHREVAMPALEAGLAAAGRPRAAVEIAMPTFLAVAFDEATLAERTATVRQQISFYASTPAYQGVLAHHGWEDAHPELNRLSKQGRWVEMADVIDDTMLHEFAIVGDAAALPAELARRYGGVVDRLILAGATGTVDDPRWADVVSAIRAI